MYIGQTALNTIVVKRQVFMIDSEQVQDCGVKISHVDLVLGGRLLCLSSLLLLILPPPYNCSNSSQPASSAPTKRTENNFFMPLPYRLRGGGDSFG